MLSPIIIWGTGNVGLQAFKTLCKQFQVVAWGDNDKSKQGLYYKGKVILGVDEVLKQYSDVSIVVALSNYYDQAYLLHSQGMEVVGYFDMDINEIQPWHSLTWKDIMTRNYLNLYAGDLEITRRKQFPDDMICLSLNRSNFYTIRHDITIPYPLPDNSVTFYQSEDVFEHIAYDNVIAVINEIYRVLSPGGWLRVSLPDYHCPEMNARCFRNKEAGIVFDPIGGGKFVDGKVVDGGHLWFPTIELVNNLISKTCFKQYEFYLYHQRNGEKVKKRIDYSKGFISRTEENGETDRSIIFDAFK